MPEIEQTKAEIKKAKARQNYKNKTKEWEERNRREIEEFQRKFIKAKGNEFKDD